KKVTDIVRVICEGESVTVGTEVFTANGDYTTHLQTSTGCDSMVNLALTVNQVPSTPAITQSNDTLYSNVIIAGANYSWYKAAVLVATTTVPYYKFASQGTYTLKITNSDCESPLSASFNTVSTGIKNNKLDVIFSVVPNPNNGQFVLNITAAKNETYQILMYNVAGQEIRKEEMSLQRGVNVKQFQLDAIEKGMYFISLIGKDGVITQNIIVQ
ncbi:MAG TPA: T9SS type A sorting domain-containing protein, partial [Chitinophagales bacterium]|nr:T9SS type A sorting domain-containing protein [Chitinophagales bacterium]